VSIRTPLIAAAIAIAVIVVGLALALTFVDWNHFKGRIEQAASARFGRQVTIAGPLQVRIWSRSPTVTLSGLTVGGPPWEADKPVLRVERMELQLELLPLFTGNLVFRRIAITHPDIYLHEESSGRANWTFESHAPTKQRASRPARVPALHDLVVDSGKMVLIDERRKLKVTGTVEAGEQASREKPKPFHIAGTGTINNEPFRLDVSGGPLRALTPYKPYPFALAITAGENRIDAQGRFLKPFDLAALELQVDASGRDLAELYYLTQITLPNTPPFKVHADIRRDGMRIAVRQIAGSLGGSDVSGTVDIDASTKRPTVKSDLISRHLLLKDFAAVTGARAGGTEALAKGAPGGAASPAKAAPKAAKRLFPDARLQVARLRAVDADLRFRATSVEAGSVPITQLSLHVKLENGDLGLQPIRFDFAQGHITGDVAITSQENPPKVHAEVRAENIQLSQFKGKGADARPPMDGILDAHAVIDGTGDSVHELMSDADGRLTVIVPHGDIESAFAELTGVDVAAGIGLLLKKPSDRATIRCGIAQFGLQTGVAHAQDIAIDTQNVLITGGGKIALGSEKLDLDIQGHPKQFRLLRLRAPIEIRGQILQPKFKLETGHLLKQGAIGAALAAVATPIAAAIAFVDPGLAKNQDCSQLLAPGRQAAPRQQASLH
jgi:uncharacterized protein involved in outer membrane biogenesis